MDFCRLFTGIPYKEYGFEGGYYLGFPVSHDVYGDGSAVVVPRSVSYADTSQAYSACLLRRIAK